MKRALLLAALGSLAVLVTGCGPSFWSEVRYYDGGHRPARPLPDFLVGRSRGWVIEHLGEPDEIGTAAGGTFVSPETYLYRDRDFDLALLQTDEQAMRSDDLLTSFRSDTRFVREMTLAIEADVVSAVTDVSYRQGPEGGDGSLASVFTGRDKAWILGQLGPPDVILPRMQGETFVYRDRTLDLWVLRVRPTIVNNPALYTRAEGNRYIQRLNVYFDQQGVVRDVSFPLGGSGP